MKKFMQLILVLFAATLASGCATNAPPGTNPHYRSAVVTGAAVGTGLACAAKWGIWAGLFCAYMGDQVAEGALWSAPAANQVPETTYRILPSGVAQRVVYKTVSTSTVPGEGTSSSGNMWERPENRNHKNAEKETPRLTPDNYREGGALPLDCKCTTGNWAADAAKIRLRAKALADLQPRCVKHEKLPNCPENPGVVAAEYRDLARALEDKQSKEGLPFTVENYRDVGALPIGCGCTTGNWGADAAGLINLAAALQKRQDACDKNGSLPNCDDVPGVYAKEYTQLANDLVAKQKQGEASKYTSE